MARTARTLAAVLASLVLLATACGDDDTAGTSDTAPTRATDPPGETVPPDTEPPGPGSDLDAELVAFVGAGSSGVDVPPALLTTSGAVAAWIGWFEAQNPEQADDLRRALAPWTVDDDPGRVLVAFAPYGCAEDGAQLTVTGADLDVALTGGEGVDCAEAVGFAVVFAVDPLGLPDGFTLAGDPPPTQVGPGTLALFTSAGLTAPPSSDVAVLDEPGLASWSEELEAAGFDATDVGDAAATAGPDEIAVGAVLQGCAEEGAELVLGPGDAVDVALVGPDDVDCDAPDTYVVVLVAPVTLLPA